MAPNPLEKAKEVKDAVFSRLTTRKSTKDFNAVLEGKKYWPSVPGGYEVGEDIGRGVSATVHIAYCEENDEIVAVKRMNLEAMQCDLEAVIYEAQTMRKYNHPNVLPIFTSFVHDQELWIVMPYCPGGSVLHIMKYGHPEGLDEVLIASIGREVLKGLDYVHKQGGIHRDVKCGNILIDQNGSVKLGDFGVAATTTRGASWGHDNQSRTTFVGTPCWMAPEVMEQTQGYDSAADIWSIGITLLEMAYGHAPFAKFPPMKVLLMTLQNAPPTLEDKGKKHFSKALKDVVALCLQKDPARRPAAAQLLEHKFFKAAREDEFLRKSLLESLPSLATRVQLIRQGKAATTVPDNDINMARSAEEYKKGVSSWNYDVGALKAQAALEIDLPTITEDDCEVDTLSGATAAQVASFIQEQTSQSICRNSPSFSYMSGPSGPSVSASQISAAASFPPTPSANMPSGSGQQQDEAMVKSAFADMFSQQSLAAVVPQLTVLRTSEAGRSEEMVPTPKTDPGMSIQATIPAAEQKKGRFTVTQTTLPGAATLSAAPTGTGSAGAPTPPGMSPSAMSGVSALTTEGSGALPAQQQPAHTFAASHAQHASHVTWSDLELASMSIHAGASGVPTPRSMSPAPGAATAAVAAVSSEGGSPSQACAQSTFQQMVPQQAHGDGLPGCAQPQGQAGCSGLPPLPHYNTSFNLLSSAAGAGAGAGEPPASNQPPAAASTASGGGMLGAAPGSNSNMSMGCGVEDCAVAECKKMGRFLVMGNGTASEGGGRGMSRVASTVAMRHSNSGVRLDMEGAPSLAAASVPLQVATGSSTNAPAPVPTPVPAQRDYPPHLPPLPATHMHAAGTPPLPSPTSAQHVLMSEVVLPANLAQLTAGSPAAMVAAGGMVQPLQLPPQAPMPTTAASCCGGLTPTGGQGGQGAQQQGQGQPGGSVVLPAILTCVAGLMEQTNRQQDMLQELMLVVMQAVNTSQPPITNPSSATAAGAGGDSAGDVHAQQAQLRALHEAMAHSAAQRRDLSRTIASITAVLAPGQQPHQL